MKLTFDELLEVYSEAIRIFDSGISWKAKYDLIFSDRISQGVDFEWYDPDTSYEEDVTSFIKAFKEYMGES